jgi:hypothetical protein
MEYVHVTYNREGAGVGPWTGHYAHLSRLEGWREARTTTPTIDEIDS